MKIFITIPDFSLHGGIRIILEWAHRLTRWHDVHLHVLKGPLQCDWFPLNPKIKVVPLEEMKHCDLLIITSPHSVHLTEHMHCPNKVVLFMQMAEHLFRPQDRVWLQRCMDFYRSPYPMIAISRWNIELLSHQFIRKAPTFHVGNGVNLDHFPLEMPTKDGRTVLVEGWESLNPSKDPEQIGPKVADRLKKRGYRIVAFSQSPLRTMKTVPAEYYQRPNLETLNQLYREATILLKASRFDARSCSPIEAMTKGTPTVRAIIEGDDDLLHGHNCLRSGYEINHTYENAIGLLRNPELYLRLAEGCHHHLRHNGWDTWMPRINDILCSV